MNLSNEYRKKMYETNKVEETPKIEEIPKPEPVKLIYPIEKKTKRKYLATESTVSFNFIVLVKKIKEHLKELFPFASANEISDRIGISLKDFTINNQTFEYTSIPNGFGGARWYVICPKCGKRSSKLFLPKTRDREPLYLCQICHKLKPSSLLLGNQKKYQEITKPLKKLERIKKKLLKKTLSTKVAGELLDEYTELERKLAGTPEYKLWKFKKEHSKDL
jgi:hypothetical protein